MLDRIQWPAQSIDKPRQTPRFPPPPIASAGQDGDESGSTVDPAIPLTHIPKS
jgi:hypothetical protein